MTGGEIGKTVKRWEVNGNQIEVYGEMPALLTGSILDTPVDVPANAYDSMFFSCTSIVKFKATFKSNINKTVNQCGLHMTFEGMSNLIEGPEILPFRQINSSALASLFYGCSSLRIPPILSSIIYARSGDSLSYAFQGCSSLEAVPYLRINNHDVVNTFNKTFYGCSKLKFDYQTSSRHQVPIPSVGSKPAHTKSDEYKNLCFETAYIDTRTGIDVGPNCFAGTGGAYKGSYYITSANDRIFYYTTNPVIGVPDN